MAGEAGDGAWQRQWRDPPHFKTFGAHTQPLNFLGGYACELAGSRQGARQEAVLSREALGQEVFDARRMRVKTQRGPVQYSVQVKCRKFKVLLVGTKPGEGCGLQRTAGMQ